MCVTNVVNIIAMEIHVLLARHILDPDAFNASHC